MFSSLFLSLLFLQVINNVPYFTSVDYFSLGLIVYQMIFGRHPFYTHKQTLRNIMLSILNMEPHYPVNMDYNLQDLLTRLLCKDQEERTELVSDIRHHKYFEEIDWTDLEKGKATSPLASGSMNKKPIYRRMKMKKFMTKVDRDRPIKAKYQKNFNGFSYMRESMRRQLLAAPPPPQSQRWFTKALACIMQ
ncbi:protein kinase C theta type-like [Aquarana catesbeiana]|uniref:protein kinase C theta type-like n=1 Tax=Aquarana catesbeiana TaxID=8400 RepID=UPI003CC96D60